MDHLLRDLKLALRALRHAPGFTAVAVLTLALGIGANSAIFTVINAVLLQPLPYHEPSRLVTVEHYYPSLNGGMEAPVSVPGFRDYRAMTSLFERATVQQGWGPSLTAEGADPERVPAARVTTDFFGTYGVSAALGRTFRADDGEAGNDRVVVLSHGLWQRRFGGDPAIVDRAIQLNGESWTVIGVMPPSFRNFFNRQAEMWAPLVFRPEQFADGNRTNESLSFTGRLRPGVSLEQARADLHAYALRVRTEFADNYPPDWDLHVTRLSDEGITELRTALYVLLGAVGFVLLIACANVANLQLARMSSRAREIAVRVALGASPRRLVSQLLTESVLLSLLGGALGLLLAVWGVPGLLALNAGNIPVDQVRVDLTVLGFTLVVSLVTGVVFGIMPAWQVARANVHGELKEGARGAGADRGRIALRRGLVVSTIALALTLTAGAGLLIRSFARLVGVDPGFAAANVVTFNVALPAARYPNDTVRVQALDDIAAALGNVPGVQSAGLTSVLPFGGGWSTAGFTVEGFTPPADAPGPWGDIRVIDPGFLPTLGVQLTRGRLFTAGDRRDTRAVAVVDEEMVARFWPGQDPLGKRLAFNGNGDSTRWIEVVGVVEHTMHEGLDGQRRVQLYLPVRQVPVSFAWFAVKTAGDPMALLASLRAAVRTVDGELPVARVATMESLIEQSTGPRRFSMLLLGLFSLLAVGLASIGLYGVMSYMVAQRTREIGVRVALGAASGDVVRMVLGQGMRLAAAGVALGLAGALAATQLMKSMLFNVGARDPLTFIAIALLLTGIALLASWLPARRAAAVDPMIALRTE